MLRLLVVFVISLVTGGAPAFAGTAFDRGVELYDYGHFPEALASFKQAAAEAPSNPLVAYYLANTFAHLGRHGSARNLYSRVLQLSPPAEVEANCRLALDRYREIERIRNQPYVNDPATLNAACARIGRQTSERRVMASSSGDYLATNVKRGSDFAHAYFKDGIDAQIEYLRAWSAGSGFGRGRIHNAWRRASAEAEIADLKAMLAEHQAFIERQRVDRMRRHRDFAEARSRALEESALNLQDLLHTAPRAGGARLSPVGTNLYVRNYVASSSGVP